MGGGRIIKVYDMFIAGSHVIVMGAQLVFIYLFIFSTKDPFGNKLFLELKGSSFCISLSCCMVNIFNYACIFYYNMLMYFNILISALIVLFLYDMQ